MTDHQPPPRRTRLPVPELGDQFPTRGNRLTRAIGRGVLRLLGWQFEGEMPNMPQAVVIGAPHTSNWDAVVGLAGIWALGVRLHVAATHRWFRPPFGPLVRWLGGVPVDQTAATGVAAQVAAEFGRRERFVIALTPEGTRRRVDRWRRGFHHIARMADVPIIPVRVDWGRKRFGLGPVVTPTADADADLATIRAYYEGVVGRHPELFSIEGIR